MKVVLHAEVQALTAKAMVAAALAVKLHAVAQNQVFALEQDRVQVREEAGGERDHVQIAAAKRGRHNGFCCSAELPGGAFS